MAYKIEFTAEEKEVFRLFSDALRVGLTATTFDDIDVVLSIKNKLKEISTAVGDEKSPIRELKPEGGYIFLDKEEHRRIKDALEKLNKPYDLIEQLQTLVQKIKGAVDKPIKEWIIKEQESK